MGAQTDPSFRGGAREGEGLTTGERPMTQREQKRDKKKKEKKDVRGSDITEGGTAGPVRRRQQAQNNLKRLVYLLNSMLDINDYNYSVVVKC